MNGSRWKSLVALAALAVGSVYCAEPVANWLDVPFVKQEKNGCGAASLWMVIAYWQGPVAADSSEIQRLLYSREAEGIYASDMERYFRREGFQTFAFRGEWADLSQHISRGRPLIVSLGKSPHYVVVAGVDEQQSLVSINDPARRKLLQLDRKDFERDWSAAGRWTLLALPPPKQ